MTIHKQVRSTEEALKLALEAWATDLEKGRQVWIPAATLRMAAAALAQPEQEPSYWLGYGLQAHTEKPFEGATPVWTKPQQPKEPEQEPVARIGFLPEVGGGKYFERLTAWKDLPVGASLYTAPPQRSSSDTPRKQLTDAQLEKGRDQTFSINNPFCPCDSKTFRKVARWVEAAHGIKGDA